MVSEVLDSCGHCPEVLYNVDLEEVLIFYFE